MCCPIDGAPRRTLAGVSEKRIGGATYRGTCYPDLVGWHFYTDYGHGGLFKARLNADDTVTLQDVPGTFPGSVASIHEAANAEMYMTTTSGRVYHLEASPLLPGSCNWSTA